jgi:stage V sporulation protein AF
MEQITKSLEKNCRILDDKIGVGRNFDVISRDLMIGGRSARLYVLDGYGDDGVIERIVSFLLQVQPEDMENTTDMDQVIRRFVTFGEVNAENRLREILTGVFLGKMALIIEGFDYCALIDAKTFPSRGVQEPSDGRVLRGAHDGFVEVLLQNTSLIRRRIRDENLTLENHKVGANSRSDIVLAYMEDRVDQKLLEEVRRKIMKIDVGSITMSQESVAEAMMAPQWYNPFPKVRYTERPDTAAACIMEGFVVLLVDNSPSVMLLPTHFFDFMEEANDYYFPPLIGTYLRYIRIAVFILSLVITPIWYLLAKSPHLVPDWLQFVTVEEEGHVPLLAQLLLVEFLIDLLKLASLNTPDVLSSSFSMIGALILGDFAVQARWLVPEVLVYMAFVSIASFAQPSFELGYAFKLMRVVLLILIAIADWWGFAAGMVLLLVLLFTTKPIVGRGYMYPVWPFNKEALSRLFIRKPINRDNS